MKIVDFLQDLLKHDRVSKKKRQKVVGDYLDHSHLWINDFLWKNDGIDRLRSYSDLKETVKDAIIIKNSMQPTEHEMITYRGTQAHHYKDFLKEAQVGSLIPFRGFTSTSSKLDVAKQFAENDPRYENEHKDYELKPLIFEIHLNKGRNAYKPNEDLYDGEFEILLPPAIYEMKDIQERDGTIIVKIDQKEMLDMEDLLLDALDNVEQNISKIPSLKVEKVEHLKSQVKKIYSPKILASTKNKTQDL